MDFSEFNFADDLQQGIESMGFTKPTPIQQQSIPVILEHHDLIACAQTGTGKTASYLLPVISEICRTGHRGLNTLILSPTRELAQQIDQQVEGLAYFTGISSIAVYGGGDGMSYENQRRALKGGVDIVIATPGRLIAHLSSGAISFANLKHLVLDEADRMLDMGFYEDIMRIVSQLPKERQTLLFSATMPPKIRKLAGAILNDPKQVNIAISKPAEGIDQQVYEVHDSQKIPLISKLIKESDVKSILVFASRKDTVKELNRTLRQMHIPSKAFHSDLEQPEREEIMRDFRNRKLQVIVGTDVLSRGIDVEKIGLVINFDVPPDPEDYVHRIGRTARAETTGTAITFVNRKDKRRFSFIEELIEKTVRRMPLPEGIAHVEESAADDAPQKNNKRKKFNKKRKPGAGHGPKGDQATTPKPHGSNSSPA
ncbi:MAG: DEAD/DEAH box helicase [Mucilaginibacter polytrichastri]|nr:DEAD/DEAH box helicase [Mucilaginibacter polytrichastri]